LTPSAALQEGRANEATSSPQGKLVERGRITSTRLDGRKQSIQQLIGGLGGAEVAGILVRKSKGPYPQPGNHKGNNCVPIPTTPPAMIAHLRMMATQRSRLSQSTALKKIAPTKQIAEMWIIRRIFGK
jgi:hypothetical protein